MISATQMNKVLLVPGTLILLFATGCASLQPQQSPAPTPPTTPDGEPTSQPGQSNSPVLGVFEGITPCSGSARPVPHISADATCEMMIWHLTLNQDPETGSPTTYRLNSAYGMAQPNTTGIAGGGTSLDLEGKWAIIQGTQDNPDAVVYQLNPDDPEMAIYFAKIDDNLLHVLTQQKSLLVGNGGWSYTLNRTDERVLPAPSPDDLAAEMTPVPNVSDGSSTAGVFEGRTPCAEIVYDFTDDPYDPACIKIKWRLTLYQDSDTGEPTYQYQGTQSAREGTWTGFSTARYPGAIILEIRFGDPEQSIFFLKPDDNHLYLLDSNLNLMVGDALWSYTLSKIP